MRGSRILSRTRVNRQLDQIFSHPLTVIRAPMGFGKTTAMREYLREQGMDSIWLSLLGSGGSLAYCWERLTAQIRKRKPDMAERLINLGFPMDISQLAKIVDIICGQTYLRPTLVVVDDYHLIDCSQVANLITLISGEQVENLHIILLARDVLYLPVADLEQRGLCWVVGQKVLQFQIPEAREYFALMEHPTSEEALRSIIRWTGGWISGIYLLLRGAKQGHPVSVNENLDQLLDDNLFSTYDLKTQDFLLKLSFLDAFSTEQVEFIFDSPSAGTQLLALAQGNAFITYSSTLRSYRMADLLREFLQKKARQKGVDPIPIWRSEGYWFLNRGKSVLAYDYLFRAGEIEAVLSDLDRAESNDIHFAQFPQIHKIFDGLPVKVAHRYPLATLRHIRVTALSGPASGREVLSRHLASMAEGFRTATDMDEEQRTLILGEIHNTWIFVAFNDVRAVVEHAREAVRYFNGRFSCVVSNRTEFTYGTPHLLYCYYREQGTLWETAEYLSQNFHTLAQAVEGCGTGSESLVLAEYALETGDFDHVTIYAQKAIYQSRSYGQTSIEICATFVLARLYLYQGRFTEGERLIEQLSAVVSSQDSSVLNTTVELCMGYISSCTGKQTAIPDWLRENHMGTGTFLFQGVAFPCIVCMRAVLLSGDFVRLEVLCQEFQKDFSIYQNLLGFIHNGICAAVAKLNLYGVEAGCKELERALLLASEDNVVMPFAENALGILPMLGKRERFSNIPQAYFDRVVECCEQYQQHVSPLLPVTLSFTLTDREKEVLQLLAQGMKHEEVANRLYISVPTVRYHVQNLYQKLKVNNKVSAIQKAKRLKLI